jgi:hypothetical protein
MGAKMLLLSAVGGAIVVIAYNPLGGDGCSSMNDCSGHGLCNAATKVCKCMNGWGSPSDISIKKMPDCSQRVCPAGLSWNSVPTSSTTAHNVMAECSDMGLCASDTGECQCFPGFAGQACQRSTSSSSSSPKLTDEKI